MVCSGGTSTDTSTLAFIGWRRITCRYQVSCFLFHLNASGLAHQCILIPATSVDVERTFSQGRLLLSHVRGRLSVQSTRALLCLGVWSLMDYVKDRDLKAAAILPEVDGEEEEELAEDWDSVTSSKASVHAI
jgi:hypothetical protein